jgi:hypothetical protein
MTKDFDYIKETKALVAELSALQLTGFPHLIRVKSWNTGRVVNFAPNAAECECNEWWDGEMMIYRPVAAFSVPNMNVKSLVLLND